MAPAMSLVDGIPSIREKGPAVGMSARRLTVIWTLLLFNGLPWIGIAVIPIPEPLGKLLSMGALAVAGLLALNLNNRLLIRPNVVLALFTLFVAVAFVSSVRGSAGAGAIVRSLRLLGFLGVLWLLTPWWGRRDLVLARCHLRALLVVSATVVVGALIAPSAAFGIGGRLAGVVWPLWPTAVGHLAAVTAGMSFVLWLSRSTRGIAVLPLGLVGVGLMLLSQTRTALLAFLGGLLCAALSLFVSRRRVRRAAAVLFILAPMATIALAPAFVTWFSRGQTTEELRGLTGRVQVWDMLLNAPRSEFVQWFGFGFSDRGFAGLPIDNSWLSIYNDQGIVGVAIIGLAVLYLLVAPAFHRPTTGRALAIFLVVYCVIESYTEVGLGDASPYLLELTVAASLLHAGGITATDDDLPGENAT